MIDVLPLLSRPTMRMFTCEARAYNRTGKERRRGGGRGELECQRASPWVQFFFFPPLSPLERVNPRSSPTQMISPSKPPRGRSLRPSRRPSLTLVLLLPTNPNSREKKPIAPASHTTSDTLYTPTPSSPLVRLSCLSQPPPKKKTACFAATRALLVMPPCFGTGCVTPPRTTLRRFVRQSPVHARTRRGADARESMAVVVVDVGGFRGGGEQRTRKNLHLCCSLLTAHR